MKHSKNSMMTDREGYNNLAIHFAYLFASPLVVELNDI